MPPAAGRYGRTDYLVKVLELTEAFGSEELEAVERLRLEFPAYSAAEGKLPPRHRVRPLRPGDVTFTPLRRGPGPEAGVEKLRLEGAAPREDVKRYKERATNLPPAPPGPEYVRGRYADQGMPRLAGSEVLLQSEALVETARECFDAGVVVPFLAYANVWLPGQLLSVHTDVPAFRGADRTSVDAWLLVVMHHSGLFREWRIPIATVVCYFDESRGGALTYHAGPHGAEHGTFVPRFNTAVAFDADTVFHEVEPLDGWTDMTSRLRQGWLRARPRRWRLDVDRNGRDTELASFRPEEVRFSLSWKAYCFSDEEEYRCWAERKDDLARDRIVPVLVEELCRRGVLEDPAHRPSGAELAGLLIDEFVPFPAAG